MSVIKLSGTILTVATTDKRDVGTHGGNQELSKNSHETSFETDKVSKSYYYKRLTNGKNTTDATMEGIKRSHFSVSQTRAPALRCAHANIHLRDFLQKS